MHTYNHPRRLLLTVVLFVLGFAAACTIMAPPAGAQGPGCVYSGGGWICAGTFPPGDNPAEPAPRIAGPDRYATSAAICEATYPDGAPALYLANGQTFADAVSAATLPEGCVLLVPTGTTLPASVQAELARHDVGVIGLGGSTAVSDAQINAANEITGG